MELVPAIWPLGHGCVMVSHAIVEDTPLFFLRAVPDNVVGRPGETATFETWDSLADSPTLTLAFAGIDALEAHIASLTALANDFRAYKPEPHP